MKKHYLFLSLLGLLCLATGWAQQKSISGTISDENGLPLPGATVVIQNTTVGTTTDFDGNFSLEASPGDVLEISYVGYQNANLTVGEADAYSLSLQLGNELAEVVVTSLGISREMKSLGYAVQSVDGEDLADVTSINAIEALSGEVSGLDIQSYNTMGGSANVIIRGFSSLTGTNQALFVVDGTPINNSTGNTRDQRTGRGGFDYGNAAMDINPEDVASVSVLRGAAATVLYGSRASNGVILITTKSGEKKEKGLGITINSTAMVGTVDKSTMPVYQNEYGQGYGPFYGGPDSRYDEWGDNLAVLTGEDASYGPRMTGQLVHHWYNMIPEWGDYQGLAPYEDPGNTPHDFLKNTITYTNAITFGGANEDGNFRLSYTNVSMEGILPNSEIGRNTFTLSGSRAFGKLTTSANITYTKTEGLGRYGTGYDNRNVFQSFRQWWGVNADVLKQKQVFEETGQNYSWNMFGPGFIPADGNPNTEPHYFDNPYWMRYNAYNTDHRNRYFGNIRLNYVVNENLSILGRVTFDQFNEVREERINVGSVDVSEYNITNRYGSEVNYDLIASYNKYLTEELNLDAILGWNLRINNWDNTFAITNGGLNFPGIYALDNSVNPIVPDEFVASNYDATKKVDGLFAQLSLGYNSTYYLEGSFRSDRSSVLPLNNNRYNYSSVSGSVIVSQLLDLPWLSFAKVRANYASVGNDVDPYRVFNTYAINPGFKGQASATNRSTFNNENLRAESTRETEFGLETQFLNGRMGASLSVYNRITDDLITPVDISGSSGATANYVNGGSVENNGVELVLNVTPVQTTDFSWDLKFNYAKNKNTVLSLAEGLEFLTLASVQGGVTVGGKPGEPFGVIRGRDFIYTNGQKTVYTVDDAPSSFWVGTYARTTNSDNVLGSIVPDWIGGIKNSFRYKNWDASFLIDIQQGGDVFSLDTYYGYATGIYDLTVGTNDLGNPIRNSIADGGGVIMEGVNANGQPNTTRARTDWYANPWGYARGNNAQHVHDASFVKLREARLGYSFSDAQLDNLPFTAATLSFVGRNLWIISKNIPYSDPEAGLSAGNIQGNQSGAYPMVNEMGINLKLQF